MELVLHRPPVEDLHLKDLNLDWFHSHPPVLPAILLSATTHCWNNFLSLAPFEAPLPHMSIRV
jgi:hypothetical protein